MGDAPKIMEKLERNQQQQRDEDREWSLVRGQLVPEVKPEELPEHRPAPIQVPTETFD